MIINIPIVSDTYTTNEEPTTNYSDSQTLMVADRSDLAIDKDYIYLKIDMSSIPSGSIINSAKMYLYCYDAWVGDTDGKDSISIHYVDQDWLSGNVTKNNEPDVWDGYQTGTPVETLDEFRFYEFDIASFVEAWVAGTRTNYGLRLSIFNSQGAEFWFRSSRYATQKPYVEVDLELPAVVPSNLYPYEGSVINLDESNTFSWTYTPSHSGDVQTGYRIEWTDGTNTYAPSGTGTQTSHTFQPGTFPEGQLQWRMRVKNSYNLYSAYTQWIDIISTKKPDTPVITTPGIVNVYRPVITWEPVTTQNAATMQVYEDGALIWDSGRVLATKNELEVGVDLENSKQYRIMVQVGNVYGLYSDWGEKYINTSFQTPEKPNMMLRLEPLGRGVIIRGINPSTGLRVIRNEVFRRKVSEEKFIKIARIGLNSEYIDYAIESNKQYEYYIRAVGETNGYINSDIRNTFIDIKDTIITDTQTNDYIKLIWNPTKQFSKKVDSQIMKFAGRKYGVLETGIYETYNTNLSFVVKEEQLEKIDEIFQNANVVLYRDNRGRKIFGSIGGYNYTDQKRNLYKLSLELIKVDYKEEVI